MVAKLLISLSQLCSNIVGIPCNVLVSPWWWYCRPFSSRSLFLKTKFPKFACILFFCCHFVVFHKIVPIAASPNSQILYGLVASVAIIVHAATLAFSLICQQNFFCQSFPRFWRLFSLEFQVVSSHKGCSVSNIMVNSELEPLLSLKLYCPSSNKFL